MQNGEAMSPDAQDSKGPPGDEENQGAVPSAPPLPQEPPPCPRPKLVFHAQLAHGSPTGRIHGFTNVRELYARIAEVFNISASEVQRVFGTQQNLFFGSKGKVAGLRSGVWVICFLGSISHDYRIKEDSTIDQIKTVCVGDHIEAINDQSIVGCRHYEVAKMLKEQLRGAPFTLRLVEPKKAFDMIGQRTRAPKSGEGKMVSGKETLRLRSKGSATLEEIPDEFEDKAIKKVDDLLESYMGIRDLELATTIVEAGKNKKNPDDFAEALDSVLGDFGFPDVFLFEVWGAMGDVKNGRI
uniref:PDZ domain-containing protein GIPC3-like n=1 Tax=Sinocyclocheilus rhinocerous TaxID=307959 RepID=A0A673N709_9TELE